MNAPEKAKALREHCQDFARSNFLPINVTLGLSTVLVCVMDFVLSPLIGAKGLWIAAGLAFVASFFLLRSAWYASKSHPTEEGKRAVAKRIMIGMLLGFVGTGAAAVSFKSDNGSWIAGASDRARGIQEILLATRQQIGALQSGVDQANAKLETLAVAGSNCQDYECAFIEGAPTSKFKELLARGLELPSNGWHLEKMLSARWPHRFEIVDLYLRNGRAIDAPFISEFHPDYLSASKQAQIDRYFGALESKGKIASYGGLPPLRWIELAQFVGDQELVAWLLKSVANPRLQNTWCKQHNAPQFSVSQWLNG